ncbi:hypothetical protein MXD81_35930 [Microbacteriaceae bacterium K1510]|nr:hypothetical protein [Microbacteriaceae bacterium K1510]
MQSSSPLQRLQNELTSEISAGTISADDKTALSSALNDIDSALKSGMQAGGTRPSPNDMQSKINDLISQEVSDGKLTSDQASELKNVFANAFQGGPGGANGAGGPPPTDADGDNDSSSTSSSTSSSSTNTDVAKLMQDFLKMIQDAQGSSSSYGASGSNLMSQIQSLVVNYTA